MSYDFSSQRRERVDMGVRRKEVTKKSATEDGDIYAREQHWDLGIAPGGARTAAWKDPKSHKRLEAGDVAEMQEIDLREELLRRNLSTSGTREQMQVRLEAALTSQKAPQPRDDQNDAEVGQEGDASTSQAAAPGQQAYTQYELERGWDAGLGIAWHGASGNTGNKSRASKVRPEVLRSPSPTEVRSILGPKCAWRTEPLPLPLRICRT